MNDRFNSSCLHISTYRIRSIALINLVLLVVHHHLYYFAVREPGTSGHPHDSTSDAPSTTSVMTRSVCRCINTNAPGQGYHTSCVLPGPSYQSICIQLPAARQCYMRPEVPSLRLYMPGCPKPSDSPLLRYCNSALTAPRL